MKCHECGKTLRDAWANCPYCGTQIEPIKADKQLDKAPSVIIEKAFVDEERDKLVIREYDANAPSNPPTVKQLAFPDPYEEGSIFIDWSEEAEKALELAGVKYFIFDPNENKEEKL